jgi:hypothetical protein
VARRARLSTRGKRAAVLVLPERGSTRVVDQPAAAADEDRATFEKARPVPLVAAAAESPDAATVCRHAGEDRAAPVASRIGGV